MRRLSDEQRAAVERPLEDACVLAGAGTGKTTVLTRRWLHLAATGAVPPRRLAALTFTERAAAEMRERILLSCLAPDAPPALARLVEEADAAPISTLHAACARWLRENAIEAGVDPAFALLDEAESRLLLEDAWIAVERRRRAADPDGLGFLSLLCEGDPGQDLAALLRAVRGVGAAPEALAFARGPVDAEAARAAVRDARAAWREAVGEAEVTADMRATLEAALVAEPSLDGFSEASFPVARAALALGTRKPAGIGGFGRTRKGLEEVKSAVAAVAGTWTALAGALLDEIAVREAQDGLRALLADLDREYAARKRDRGALDFADLELETIGLLDRLAARGRRPDGAPDALLVDEHQDTNPVQVRLLRALRGANDVPYATQFAVGDPFQSIYRFRGADVRGIVSEWEAVGVAGRARLRESYRSHPALLRAVDGLLRDAFATGQGVPYEPLAARATFSGDPDVPFEVLVVEAGPTIDVARRAEARAIARRIRAWVDGGTPRHKRAAGDAPDAPSRALRWGDVAVLLRTWSDVKTYERALLEEGVPFVVGKGRGFYRTSEVQDLLHLLRVVHDPTDGFAVAAWLASPAVGATDADLLAAAPEREVPGPTPPPDLEGAARTSPRVRAGLAVVARLRRLAAAASLEETVEEALRATRAREVALLQDAGERRARNLSKAASIARRMDRDGGHGLADYLRRLTDLVEREADEGEAAAGVVGNAVTITTVHGAKGLEWPCVVVADAGRGGGGKTPAFRCDDVGRVAWRLRDPLEGDTMPTSGYAALQASDAAAEAAESMRVLYVALTRAEERVLFSFPVTGVNEDGTWTRLNGWARDVWGRLGVPHRAMDRAPTDVVGVVATVEAATPSVPAAERVPWFVARPLDALLAVGDAAVPKAVSERARTALARVRGDRRPRGETPFVVAVSDLLAFADSPARWYEGRHLGARRPAFAPVAAEPDDPASSEDGVGPDAGREERAERWDEGTEPVDGLDRAALGRAVHATLERADALEDVPTDTLARALSDEMPPGVAARALPLAAAMVARFQASETARAVRAAVAAGRAVRREAAFHARIRFPEGEEVDGHRALLVKGTIDLWLEDGPGVVVVDHKTNSPRGRLRTVEAMREHYAAQLRLYALAAERVLGRDVDRARLLLLDPEWGGAAPACEVEVDVSGERLREARSLCRAFALALSRDRYPPRWRDLLADGARSPADARG